MIFASLNLQGYLFLLQSTEHRLSITDAIKLIPRDSAIAGAIVISAVIILVVILMFIRRAEVRRKTKRIPDEAKLPGNMGLQDTMVEITRLKNLYALARDEKEKFEYLYNNSVFGIITLSTEGEIRSVNRVASLLLSGLNLPDKNLIGKKIQDFLAPDDESTGSGTGGSAFGRDARSDLNELLSSKEEFARFDARIKPDSGKPVVVEFAIQFDRDSGTFHMSIQDISDRKAYEEYAAYEEKIESLEKLARSLSHDLNNIVGSIMGYASLLKKKLSPDTKEFHYADIIENSAKRTTDLVKQVLGFSHLDTKAIGVIDLNKFVDDAAADFGRTHSDKYAVTMSAAGQPAMVEASVSQLKQVLRAILENAAESMEKGGTIECSVSIVEKSGPLHEFPSKAKQCVIGIEDHGTGMDEAIKRRIFEPFFTTKREKKYTGLSLSAAFNIIKHHKGHISVDSTPHVGTNVKIYLPQHSEKAGSKAGTPSSETDIPKGTKVMVVDDEESVRQLGYDILTEQGYQVITTSNGLRALEKLREEPDIRVVVLDMIMPVMGGKEACIEIKKMAHPPKVLICTGFSELSDLETIIGTYAESLLQKPYTTGELAAAVADLLKE
ncbi:MAG: response regulator [Candidatus Kryptoniota bacterium]